MYIARDIEVLMSGVHCRHLLWFKSCTLARRSSIPRGHFSKMFLKSELKDLLRGSLWFSHQSHLTVPGHTCIGTNSLYQGARVITRGIMQKHPLRLYCGPTVGDGSDACYDRDKQVWSELVSERRSSLAQNCREYTLVYYIDHFVLYILI